MSLSRKAKIFIGIGLAVAVIILAVVGYGAWSLYSFFSQISSLTKVEIPAALQEAKVFTGGEFLTKSEVFKLKKLSYSEIISQSLKIPDEKARQQFISSETSKGIFKFQDLKICRDEVIAAGKFGGYVFDRSGELKREIYFEPSERTIQIGWYQQKEHKADLDNLRIVELDNRGRCGFLSHGYQEGVTVYDLKGKRVWNYGEETVADLGKMLSEKDEDSDKKIYVTEASVGDLDGDGLAEIIVSRRNDGIRVFDQNKNEIWFQPDEFPTADFRFIDTDGDGLDELIEFQGMNSTVRDKATGNIIKKIEIDGWQKDFLLSENSKKKQVVQLFHIDENKFFLSDLNNKTLLETEAPLSEVKLDNTKKVDIPGYPEMSYTADSESVAYPKSVWVSLQKDKPKYLAVVASFTSLPRSNFYVYDEKGTLVYHELLPEDAETIAVIPAANAAEEILIGGKDTIWRYAAK